MILVFKAALLVALLYCMPLLKHPMLAALFYWLGWFTPWVIPNAIDGQASWYSLVVAVLVFLAAWAVFALNSFLADKHPAASWRWPFVGAAGLLLVVVF